MTATQEDRATTANNKRQFRSPNRILARSFRLARDKWKQKYMKVRAELKSARQLATERGTSRNRWRGECDAANQRAIQADVLAEQRLEELEQLRSEAAGTQKNESSKLPRFERRSASARLHTGGNYSVVHPVRR